MNPVLRHVNKSDVSGRQPPVAHVADHADDFAQDVLVTPERILRPIGSPVPNTRRAIVSLIIMTGANAAMSCG